MQESISKKQLKHNRENKVKSTWVKYYENRGLIVNLDSSWVRESKSPPDCDGFYEYLVHIQLDSGVYYQFKNDSKDDIDLNEKIKVNVRIV